MCAGGADLTAAPFEGAAAQADSGKAYLQPEIVVTGTRTPFLKSRVPRSVDVVTPQAVATAVLATVPDLLSMAPGVLVQKTTAGGGSVYLSGMLGNYCLLLTDGIRINNSALRTGPNQYLNTLDPASVERVEILQGPGSVLYGSDAFGGVVNVLSPSALAEGMGQPDVRVRAQYGGPESRRVGALRLTRRVGHMGMLLNLSTARYHDLRGGDTTGAQSPTGYESHSGALKLSVPMGAPGVLTLAAQHVQQNDVPRYDRLSGGKDLEHVFNPQRRTLVYARAQRQFSLVGRPEVQATVSYHDQDEGRRYVTKSKPTIAVRERDRVGTWGLELQGHWRGEGGASFVTGIETYYDEIQSGRWKTDLETGHVSGVAATFPDGTNYLSSAWLAQWSRPVVGRLALHVGARLNVFSIRAPMPAPYRRLSESYSEPTGEVRFLWDAGTAALPSIYAGVGRAFRAPNAYDLTAVGTFNAGIEAPNQDLRPERAWAYELGAKRSAGRLSYQGRLHFSDLEDLLVREPGEYQGSDSLDGQRVYVKRNSGRARLWGWSAGAGWLLVGGLMAEASAGYAWGQNLSDHEPMQRIPPVFGRAALERTWSRWVLVAAVDWARPQRRLSSQDEADTRIPKGGTPGFGVLGLTSRWRLPGGLALDVRADNLLDADYRVHGSGVNAGGRSIAVEVHWSRFEGRSAASSAQVSPRL
jgi:outer membrane receptor protein involved in Fe transport